MMMRPVYYPPKQPMYHIPRHQFRGPNTFTWC
jgi:hypothetical protein